MNDSGFPRLVRGTVTRHEAYGVFVDLGEVREALLEIPMMAEGHSNHPFPSIGSSLEAALLGYTDPGGEPRLSLLPHDLEVAAQNC